MSKNPDIEVISTSDEQESRLKSRDPWDMPLIVLRESELGKDWNARCGKGRQDIQEFLSYFRENELFSIQVFAGKEPETVFKSFAEISEYFSKVPADRQEVWNCLDLSCKTNTNYIPSEIWGYDKYQESEKEVDNAGRGGKSKDLGIFFLLSGEGAISPTHVDAGGPCTWMRPICGHKVCYFARGIFLQENKDRFRQQDVLDPRGYVGGWSKIVLRPGDTLIMCPGLQHAVS